MHLEAESSVTNNILLKQSTLLTFWNDHAVYIADIRQNFAFEKPLFKNEPNGFLMRYFLVLVESFSYDLRKCETVYKKMKFS